MDVTKSVRLSEVLTIANAPTQSEAYRVNSDILGLKLSFRGAENAVAFELLQNEPNPFSNMKHNWIYAPLYPISLP